MMKFVCTACGENCYGASPESSGNCPYCNAPVVLESTVADETIRIKKIFLVKEFEELIASLRVLVEIHRGEETKNLEKFVDMLEVILNEAQDKNWAEINLSEHPFNRFFLHGVSVDLEDTIKKVLPRDASWAVRNRLTELLEDVYAAS